MKKKLFTLSAALIFAVCSLFFCISASAEVYEGNCGTQGDNVTYKLDTETGLLEIIGAGEMKDYPPLGSFLYTIGYYVKSVKIFDGVTNIGDFAFGYCRSLTSVIIPDSVRSIGECAFYDCCSLSLDEIPHSVTSIGNGAFSGTAYYNDSSNWENGNVLYIGDYLIEAKDSILGSYSIKDGTLTIAGYAFSSCSSLTSITIPDSVISIGECAFYYCTGLKVIEVEENNEVYCDIDGVLFTKDKKTIIVYPIGGETVYVIPDGVTSIGSHTFHYCSDLTSVTIPNGVKHIGDYAFCYCSSLTNITLPDSVTIIGDRAFSGCGDIEKLYISNLESWLNVNLSNTSSHPLYWGGGNLYIDGNLATDIEIPNTVSSIGAYAFYNCYSIKSITIPNSITSIGEFAFSDCISLANVAIKSKNTTIDSRAFYGCYSLETIYLYKNSTADEYFSDEEYTKIYLDDIEFGDASGDDVINAKDVMLLAKSFTGWDVEIDKTAADCNLDGVFDMKDLVLLTQYLAGWNVTLG